MLIRLVSWHRAHVQEIDVDVGETFENEATSTQLQDLVRDAGGLVSLAQDYGICIVCVATTLILVLGRRHQVEVTSRIK